MKSTRRLKIIVDLLCIFITMPIWYYLFYQILIRVQASELMLFLGDYRLDKRSR